MAVVGLALLVWFFSFTRNTNYINDVNSLALESETLVSQISPANLDPLEPLDALNALRDLAHRGDSTSIQTSFTQGFGLSQEGKLSSVGEAAYRRILLQAFLPRILLGCLQLT